MYNNDIYILYIRILNVHFYFTYDVTPNIFIIIKFSV